MSRAAGAADDARRAMRGGLVFGARIVCDAMRCDGCTGCDAMRCDTRDAMRGPMCCQLVAMQCAALRCTVRGLFAMQCAAMQCAARGLVAFARCNALRCNALRAGWLHSRGAGGAMLLTEGFLGWDGWRDGCKGGV